MRTPALPASAVGLPHGGENEPVARRERGRRRIRRAGRASITERPLAVRHLVTEKADRPAGPRRRRSAGDRPPGFDKARYTKRHTLERAINRLPRGGHAAALMISLRS